MSKTSVSTWNPLYQDQSMFRGLPNYRRSARARRLVFTGNRPNEIAFSILWNRLKGRDSWRITPAFLQNVASHFRLNAGQVKFMLNVFVDLDACGFDRYPATGNGNPIIYLYPRRHFAWQPLRNSKVYRKAYDSNRLATYRFQNVWVHRL